MQKPSSGAPVKTRGNFPRDRPILPCVAHRPSDVNSAVGSTATNEDTSVVTRSTVGVHAVTKLTQPSDKSPSGQNKGLSDGTSARQGRVGLWKSTEEEELKRLVGIHTGPKGTVSWVKVVEAWNSLELPTRTKASLSSKWTEIKSRSTVLDSTSQQNSTDLCSTSSIIVSQQQSDVNTTQVVNIAVKSPKRKRPAVSTAAPAPVKNSLNLETKGDCSKKKDATASVFKKNLKKARKIGCEVYRKPPKRVTSSKTTQSILSKVDDLMREEVDLKMQGKPSWNQLSILVYAGAMTVDELCNQASDEKRNRSKLWFSSSYREVDKLRKVIGKATAELERRKNKAEVAPTDRQLNNIRLLEKKYKSKTFVEITSLVEKLKGRLQLLLARIELRKADEQRSFVRHSPAKMLFRDKESKDSPNTANVAQIRRYWKNIVGVKKTFERNNPLLLAWKQALPEHSAESNLNDCLDLVLWQRVVSKLKPWKAAGPDGLQGFWWKTFKTGSILLYKLVHHHLTSGASLPQRWISNGRIILLFKSGSRFDPANYRPIACLNTCYKLLTGLVTAYLDQYVTERNILAKEQRALQKNVWGCTHALILDQTLITDAQYQKQRPISVGWIDYAKAFDSVPHTYIQWLLGVMQVPVLLRKFLKGLMNSWRVKYEAKSPGGKIERSSFLRIRSGVLQGDSFSPLLFCLAMVPISHALNNTKCCYTTASGKLTKTQLSLSHQFYMDDLKLYADSRENLMILLLTVEAISSAINMKINSKKCAVAHYIPKRLRKEEIKDDLPKEDGEIQNLEGGLYYKYLGMDQEFNTKESFTWDRVKDRCIEKFRKVWTSDLTFRQKIDVHNSTIIPALTYVSSNIIKGGGKYEAQLSQGQKLDQKFRTILVKEKARYKSSAKSRLYVSSERGGYGLKSVRDSIEESTIYTWAYLCTRADLKPSYTLFEKMANRGKRSVISDARRVLEEYNIDLEMEVTTPAVILDGVRYVKPTLLARRVVELMRSANDNRRYEEWKKLKRASRVLRSTQAIDLVTSFEWLHKGRLSSIGVRNVLAAQEGCLLTRSHPAYSNTGEGTGCRKCKTTTETVEHVVSCCPKWLTTLYIDRHDSVARNIHHILCQKYDLQAPHYTQRVNPIIENDSVRLYWNQPVQTRAIIRHNKPDLIVFDKVRKTALIIEVAVSWFTGMEKQKELKSNRYCVNGNWEDELASPYPRGENLVSELSSTGWEVTFLPVIIGATGEILSDIKDQIQDKLSLSVQACLKLIERLQRSAVLGTSRVVRNHLRT